MKRRVIYGVVGVVLGLNLLVGAWIYQGSAQAAEKDSPYNSLKLFSYALEKVRREYVDGQKFTYQDLVYGALKGMLNTLDPHSEFMDPEKFKELQNDTQGAFGGLGLLVQVKDGHVTVAAPMPNTPGSKAGILGGDRILKINGKSTDKMGLEDAVGSLRGDPGTTVKLTIFRPSNGQTRDYVLTRASINVDMVTDLNGKKEFPLADNKIGYVRLTQFGEKASDELETALRKLKKQEMQGLIVDLRWNPGGLLDQAIAVCSKFLPRGQLVVTTEGRDPSQNLPHYAGGHDELNGLPMVVLVNVNSASASEIVAGCLQDLKRAIILGERTFGKGSVQTILPLGDGSALRLTTAKYYTPSHKVIHEQGVTPDITVTLSAEEDHAAQVLHSPGGTEGLDEAERQRVLGTPDPQMERAIDLLKGITLYTQRAPLPEKRVIRNQKIAAVK